jgi:hypothetical protein
MFYVVPTKISSLKAIRVNGKEISISSSDKAVYSVLYGFQTHGKKVNPSQEYIATMLGMSIKGVRDSIAKLEVFKLLEKVCSKVGVSNYSYKIFDVDTIPEMDRVYPDYSKELKTSRNKGATLLPELIGRIKNGDYVPTMKTPPTKSNNKTYVDPYLSSEIDMDNIPF